MHLTLISEPTKIYNIEPIFNGKAFWLREPIRYIDKFGNFETQGKEVPIGFVFDGYSIPFGRKIFNREWNLSDACLHDWQYFTGFPRDIADRSLGVNMLRSGNTTFSARCVACGVNLFGWIPYEHYRMTRMHMAWSSANRIAEDKKTAERIAMVITV